MKNKVREASVNFQPHGKAFVNAHGFELACDGTDPDFEFINIEEGMMGDVMTYKYKGEQYQGFVYVRR